MAVAFQDNAFQEYSGATAFQELAVVPPPPVVPPATPAVTDRSLVEHSGSRGGYTIPPQYMGGGVVGGGWTDSSMPVTAADKVAGPTVLWPEDLAKMRRRREDDELGAGLL